MPPGRPCACGCNRWIPRRDGRQRTWASRACFARDPQLAEFRQRRVHAMVSAATKNRRRRAVERAARYDSPAAAFTGGYRLGYNTAARWWKAKHARLFAEVEALRKGRAA